MENIEKLTYSREIDLMLYFEVVADQESSRETKMYGARDESGDSPPCDSLF